MAQSFHDVTSDLFGLQACPKLMKRCRTGGVSVMNQCIFHNSKLCANLRRNRLKPVLYWVACTCMWVLTQIPCVGQMQSPDVPGIHQQWLHSSPGFGIWSRSGPQCQNCPKKGLILLLKFYLASVRLQLSLRCRLWLPQQQLRSPSRSPLPLTQSFPSRQLSFKSQLNLRQT